MGEGGGGGDGPLSRPDWSSIQIGYYRYPGDKGEGRAHSCIHDYGGPHKCSTGKYV